MFTTTISMWLGIVFLGLCVVAVLLQAWLWGPKYWDEEARRTRAPRGLLRLHAFAGYSYGLIYLFMMWHMLPRMWEYQYELPARTVFHAVVAIVIGVLLISKICILLFFRHFEEAMPRFGFGLLVCTVLLVALSVPYALRAHDFGHETTSPDNLARVERLLADVDLGEGVDLKEVVSERGLDRGRTVLVTKCTACHDMRTILIKPRTANKWHEVNLRMLEKPAVFGERLSLEDVPWVTAYLVAITPDIQESMKSRRHARAAESKNAEEVAESVHLADDFEAPKIDEAAGEQLVLAKCTECHELDEIDEHGGDDVAGWRSVVAAMVEEGAEIDDEEAAQLSAYLAHRYPGGAQPAAIKEPEPEPEPEQEPEPEPESEPTPSASPDLKNPFAKMDEEKEKGRPRPKKPKAKPEASDEEATSPDEPKPKPAAKPKGDATAGQAVFLKKCKSCHGADGKGESAYGQKIGVPNLVGTSLGKNAVRSAIRNGKSGTKMRGYASKLSDQEIEDLVVFVKSL